VLVADGWDRIRANGRKVDRAVVFFVNLADKDAIRAVNMVSKRW
jgi:hypothetical protein